MWGHAVTHRTTNFMSIHNCFRLNPKVYTMFQNKTFDITVVPSFMNSVSKISLKSQNIITINFSVSQCLTFLGFLSKWHASLFRFFSGLYMHEFNPYLVPSHNWYIYSPLLCSTQGTSRPWAFWVSWTSVTCVDIHLAYDMEIQWQYVKISWS